MSAPTTAFSSGTGTISATGESSGLLLAISPLLSSPRVRFGISGTFTSCVVAIRGRLNGLTNYYPVKAVQPNGGAVISDCTSISLTDSTNAAVEIDASGCDSVEMWLVSGTGPITVEERTYAGHGALVNVLNTTISGTQTYTGASTVNVSSATAFVVGPNGTTNPTLTVVTNVASEATGLKITGAAAAGGLALVVTSSGTDEALTINAKGAGAIGIGSVSTGAVTITPATTITGALTQTGALTGASSIKSTSPTAGVGYATGAGGAVTQATNRSTGVTLNTICGTITTDSTSLAAGAAAQFTVTNSAVAATDTVAVSIKSGATTTQTTVSVNTVAAGSFKITVNNGHASTAETAALLINFVVIKGVTS